MVDPTKQRGDAGRPMGPEPEKEQQVDPEKFKKVLKVEQVDPSEKRQQRRLKKGEEEGDEDEDVEGKAQPPPSSSFSEFMQDKDELDGLFDAESSGVRKQAAPQTSKTAPEAGSINTEGVELGAEEEPPAAQQQAQAAPSPYEPQTSSQEAAPPPSEQAPSYGQGEEQFPEYGTPQYQQPEQQPTNQPTYPTQEEQQTQPTTEANQQGQEDSSSNKKDDDTSLLASQPAKDALKSKKKAPTKPAPRVETIQPEEKGPAPTKEEAKPEQLFPQAGEESVMPTFMGAQTPTGEEKGEKVAEKPLEAPMPGDAKLPLEHKGVPTDAKEETGEVSPEGVQKKGTTIPKAEIPEDAAPKTRPQTAVTFERYTPEQIRDQKMGKPSGLPAIAATEEGLTTPPLPEEEMGMMGEGKKDKKDDFPFISADELTANLPPIEQPFAAVTPPTDAPPHSQLSPQAYELFEKMAGTILVQTHSGITSTTVTLNMPNSMFNGAQVILDQYSTAPQAYNLQLVGSPQAVQAFNANMADLVAAFKQSEHAFEVNLLKPVLEGKKPLIRRKGAAGDGGGKGKK